MYYVEQRTRWRIEHFMEIWLQILRSVLLHSVTALSALIHFASFHDHAKTYFLGPSAESGWAPAAICWPSRMTVCFNLSESGPSRLGDHIFYCRS